jgi:hypothetical protein
MHPAVFWLMLLNVMIVCGMTFIFLFYKPYMIRVFNILGTYYRNPNNFNHQARLRSAGWDAKTAIDKLKTMGIVAGVNFGGATVFGVGEVQFINEYFLLQLLISSFNVLILGKALYWSFRACAKFDS